MKTKTCAFKRLNPRYWLVVPAAIALMSIFYGCASKSGNSGGRSVFKSQVSITGNDSIYVKPDEMPVFPGGENALTDFLRKNLTYPDSARQNLVQGTITLKFCITDSGSVEQVEIVQGVDPSIDREALRVVRQLPSWHPGKKDGKAVKVWYFLPINFRLEGKVFGIK